MKEKLFLKGFTNEIIDKAMSQYDFEYDNEKENINIRIERFGMFNFM